ncbi:MAG: flagellar biosynthesis protein FlhF [Zoogloeaceae bacterium]|jgi:flagellar biosynthesis protein FlhF|nr:flagellar biosynthesis protein FlhF [Zoogloeaceae bacterium]
MSVIKKFVASSARDALRKVKELLGPDAIILSNRATHEGVEIMAVAARDMDMLVPAERQEKVSRPSDDYTVQLSAAASAMRPAARTRSVARENVPPPLAPRPMPRLERSERTETVSASRQAEIIPAEVMEEIRSLRKMVEQQLAGVAWGEKARSEPVKAEILRQMLAAGFSPQLARELLAGLPLELNTAKAMGWAKAVADRSLLTIDSENDIINRGGVYALVGPTGVGKTTTTAKLATRCVLNHGANKVALITTDFYRIGAHEQLRSYGRILGVPVYMVKDAEDLQQMLASLRRMHIVLIDTIGMSQRDRMVEEQIAMFGHSGVNRLLLLDATKCGDTQDDIVRAYGGVDIAGGILSKVDEAASLAPSLDVIIRHRLPLHYVSNGQRVPEDLHLPNRVYLMHRAFRDLPESSPHRLDDVESRMVFASAPGAAAVGGRRV